MDFVITFEELQGMFEAKGLLLDNMQPGEPLNDATGAGRGYGVAGGVASAIEECIREYYPDINVHIEHAESLTECKKILMLAKAGKKNGCLIEGMGMSWRMCCRSRHEYSHSTGHEGSGRLQGCS